jgi:hypothetical protein
MIFTSGRAVPPVLAAALAGFGLSEFAIFDRRKVSA